LCNIQERLAVIEKAATLYSHHPDIFTVGDERPAAACVYRDFLALCPGGAVMLRNIKAVYILNCYVQIAPMAWRPTPTTTEVKTCLPPLATKLAKAAAEEASTAIGAPLGVDATFPYLQIVQVQRETGKTFPEFFSEYVTEIMLISEFCALHPGHKFTLLKAQYDDTLHKMDNKQLAAECTKLKLTAPCPALVPNARVLTVDALKAKFEERHPEAVDALQYEEGPAPHTKALDRLKARICPPVVSSGPVDDRKRGVDAEDEHVGWSDSWDKTLLSEMTGPPRCFGRVRRA